MRSARQSPGHVPCPTRELEELGVRRGMALLVHSSFRSLGWSAEALRPSAWLGTKAWAAGTTVMPAQSTGSRGAQGTRPYRSRRGGHHPRDHAPRSTPDMTPTKWMDVLECFRKPRGALRGDTRSARFRLCRQEAGVCGTPTTPSRGWSATASRTPARGLVSLAERAQLRERLRPH
jgi:hypothetical protein